MSTPETRQHETVIEIPAPVEEVWKAITEAFAVIVAKYHDKSAPGGRSFRLMLGAWPSLPETPDEEEK